MTPIAHNGHIAGRTLVSTRTGPLFNLYREKRTVTNGCEHKVKRFRVFSQIFPSSEFQCGPITDSQ
jgi:hypothetical protein